MGGKKKSGDAAKGEKVFTGLCAVCHAFGSHGTGPNLQGVVNSKPASKDGFSYSAALKDVKGNWTEKNLYKYIKSPGDYAPGNAMAFAGIAKADDRADLIAYLKT